MDPGGKDIETPENSRIPEIDRMILSPELASIRRNINHDARKIPKEIRGK
jgi:hypothetical protein